MDDILARLNACAELSLHKVIAEDDGPLRLVVEVYDLAKVAATYELRWEEYVAYSVTGDNYPPQDAESRSNKVGYFSESQSDFMNFIEQSKTGIFDILDRPLKSWRLSTFTRYVDVVSYSPVEIITIS